MEDLLKALNITYEQFVELCILFGCDYNEKIKDISPETIYHIYSEHKNISGTLKALNKNLSELDNYSSYKKYFLNPPVHDIKSIEYKKPNIAELDKLLVSKYGLVRIKILSKLRFLENIKL